MSAKHKKSIKSRWIKNILAVTVAILLILATVILYTVYTRYITAAEMTIKARISPSVDHFFSYYNTDDDEFFALGANEYVENFAYKDKIELLVMDKTGKVIVSSNAFGASSTTDFQDYYDALSSYDRMGKCLSRTGSGEKVLAISYVLRDSDGENLGALRYLVSLDDAYKQFYLISVIVILSFALIIMLISLLGRYFVSSIVQPVEKINQITKEIAKGDFSVRLQTDSDDEIGELSESINEMANQLNEIDRMKNEFISTVSHEIRTPLTAIKGWGETLKSIGNDPQLTNKGLDIIISETSRLSDMVEELLDFSRMQNDNMKINCTSFDIVKLIEEVYLSNRQRAEAENKLLSFNIKENAHLFVKADESKIKQVMINLFDNALKYTDEGGEIRINLERNLKYVTIFIEDTGRGISEKDLPHIKEKFYKADNTVRGTGIGLAVADEIVKKHGGILNISSKIGQGTLAEVTLPIHALEV